jgi:voltage-gated potassium channel
MHNLVYLLLRRMRLPLIMVILAYAVSVLGLVLIPGIDDQGNPWRMDFFHAFYFVSFLGSTIGLGEIPYPFTDAQRLWTMVAIYTTVIAWLFAIGSLFALFSDQAFRRILAYTLFTRTVRGIREPFYLVCGLGDAAHLLVHELAGHWIRTVVIDNRESRIQALQLDDLPVYVPALCADAADASTLCAAGVNSRHCMGVIALTDSDHVNLTIAITSKLIAIPSQGLDETELCSPVPPNRDGRSQSSPSKLGHTSIQPAGSGTLAAAGELWPKLAESAKKSANSTVPFPSISPAE